MVAADRPFPKTKRSLHALFDVESEQKLSCIRHGRLSEILNAITVPTELHSKSGLSIHAQQLYCMNGPEKRLMNEGQRGKKKNLFAPFPRGENDVLIGPPLRLHSSAGWKVFERPSRPCT